MCFDESKVWFSFREKSNNGYIVKEGQGQKNLSVNQLSR